MTERLDVLRRSVEHLRAIVEPLSDAEIERRAYPTDWTIADVLSHLGSGALIQQRRVEAAVGGDPMPDDFPQSVWDAWNAKTPRAKVDDALAADADLVDGLSAVTDEQRPTFRPSMGTMSFDYPTFVGLRVNEHTLHTWDVAVALDPAATLFADAVPTVVDNLDLVAGWTGKPVGTTRTVVVHTTDPARDFTIELREDGLGFSSGGGDDAADLELPAEAFVRLVFGRLDPDHTPAFSGDAAAVDLLRLAFPGP
jgi:uncharacterized protein (TIGR03083 family)